MARVAVCSVAIGVVLLCIACFRLRLGIESSADVLLFASSILLLCGIIGCVYALILITGG